MRITRLIVLILCLAMTCVVAADAAPTQNTAAATAFREARDLIGDGEWERAEARLNRFIADFPQDREAPAALYWLAFSLKQQNKFPAADAALTRLIERYPSSTWINDARALRVEIAPRLRNNQVIEQGVNDANDEIRLTALQSLFEARPERGVALAADLLRANSGASRMMKEGAIELLADSETKEAIPVLLQVARTDNDMRVRRMAIEALGEIEDVDVIEPLRTLATQSTDESIARAAVEALAERGVSARKVLLDIARSNANIQLRLEAIEALAEDEDDSAVVDDLIALMSATKEPSLQLKVIEALGELESPRAETALADLARTSTSVEVRLQAIEALGDREDSQSAVERLAQLYDTEKDEGVKAEIIHALGDSEERAALRKLSEIAARDSSLKLRRLALEALSDSEDPEAIKLFEEILTQGRGQR
jgi:HEAT repeat protein